MRNSDPMRQDWPLPQDCIPHQLSTAAALTMGCQYFVKYETVARPPNRLSLSDTAANAELVKIDCHPETDSQPPRSNNIDHSH